MRRRRSPEPILRDDEMSLSRDSRAERKLKAVRRAQFSLKQRLEKIDFEEDVLMPEVEALKAGKSILGLPAGSAFDIQIEVESNDASGGQSETAGTSPTIERRRRSRARPLARHAGARLRR